MTAEIFRNYAKEELGKIHKSSSNEFKGFDIIGSSLPPQMIYDKVSDMRASPKYIHLYAASDMYIALLEARSNINTLVSVSNIELLDDLIIFDITKIMILLTNYMTFCLC